MGEVYRARDPRLGREVAIKVLPAGSAGDSERMRRFEQEARATAALSHPNILAVFNIDSQDNSPYIVSELLEGETLRARLISGPLPVRKAVDYALQTASGLTAAHNHGIFHRDLKPENLFITRDGHVKILDFGLAKLTMRSEEHTSELQSRLHLVCRLLLEKKNKLRQSDSWIRVSPSTTRGPSPSLRSYPECRHILTPCCASSSLFS